jgi:transposase
MVGYRSGQDRNQATFLPAVLDDYVGEDHPCRVIDAFVDGLDMEARGFAHTGGQKTGSPAYDPKVLMKLYLYGYMNRVRSSRRLEAEACRNVEVMWLLCGQRPDDRTICNFRSRNADALKAVFRDFNKLCLKWGLFGLDLASLDGTKVRANNSKKHRHTEDGAKKMLARIDKKIAEFLAAFEQNDALESDDVKPDRAAAAEMIEKLRAKKADVEEVLRKIEENGGEPVCTVDPDAALMKQGGGKGFDVCYNVQAGVDGAHGLISDFDVTNHGNDLCELSGMAERLKDALETDGGFDILADKGYSNGKEIKACEEMGVECYIPKPAPSHQPEDPKYHRNQFVYDAEKNAFVCPEGHEMPQVRVRARDGYVVYANRAACKDCPAKEKCTKSKTLREIERNPHQAYTDRAAANAKENPGKYRRRQELSEHPFGVVKHIWGFSQFLCRGVEKVQAETSLMFLAFNFRRVLNILGVQKMLELMA